ncbi:MAG: aspartate kinase [Bacteroides sp.]|nr:aspartate kinase [Bacillota bacterium]MCM1393845.1 aspartate kinase [[Eubacterium] siraeum]MCM1455972.1 aspartate kinase [Bacteroides sp.]
MKVCKFGGTSMANGRARVVEIINGDRTRRFIVVSAPGKRDKSDIKITDALYNCYDEIAASGSCDKSFEIISERFCDMASEISPKLDIKGILSCVKRDMETRRSREFCASRGEYLSAIVLSSRLGAEFIDAAGLILFDGEGNLLLEKSIENLKDRLTGVKRAVIPGFYGSDAESEIRTFSRGGSDITGAIVARAVNADVYENWTDVDGFLSADPRIVDNPKIIDCLSYRELRELAYMGAEVLHPESIFPVRSAGIPINIRNTFNPSYKGTMIVANGKLKKKDDKAITGIAGKKNFTIINIEKDMMNSEIGFGRKVLGVLEEEGISFEHLPSGIDTLSVVIRDEYLNSKMQRVLARLQDAVNGDSIDIHKGLALIATVGHAMASRKGTAATLFNALAKCGVNVRMIDQGSSELNIIVAVDTSDYEKAINAIYRAFIADDVILKK